MNPFHRLVGSTVLALALSASAQPYGLNSRPLIGPFLNDVMPESAPAIAGNWTAVVAFTNLYFTNALGLTQVPGTNRLCVWEREGRVWTFDHNPAATQKTLVLDISNQCQGWDDCGLLNLAFHPGFATNHYVFLYYTWVTPGTVVGNPTNRPSHHIVGKYHDRLSRFTLDANGVAIPGSEVVFVDVTGNDTWHNGSGMFFHPDNGFLYWTDGDDTEPTNRQVISNSLFAGVFRIDVDQRGGSISHPIPRQPNNGFTANYYIPNDNPFVGQSNALEEFFCLGLRSPHRMTHDVLTDRIYIGDVGQGTREEVDIIEPGESGLNFQWSLAEGFINSQTAVSIGLSTPPVLDYPHTDGQAVIAGHVYRGQEFADELNGWFIFGDNVSRVIWALDESITPAAKIPMCTLPKGGGPNSGSDYTGLSSFGVDANGELYMCQMSSVGGQIYKLAHSGPPPASRPLPQLLSQTGVFTNFTTLAPNPGLLPYSVNAPLWSDGAAKTRWIAVPTNTFITFAPTGEWTFPGGTVFVKHFELSTNDTSAGELRRLETRLLVRDTNGGVYGATYKWRPDYSDADLVIAGTNENIMIATATGVRTQQWYYPGRQDCLNCHRAAAAGVLGVKTRQQNGDFSYPSTGITDNQLRTWNHIGMFTSALNESSIPGYSQLAAITNSSATLEHRVRSYLDANCAHCHRPGGGVNALFDARFDTPLSSQGIVNGTVLNSLGITGARVVRPGETNKSILLQRDNSIGEIQMPPLAKNVIDSNAMPVLIDWINQLPPGTLPAPWTNADVGTVGLAGDATYSAGEFSITGSGADIWDTADAFHFAYLLMTGDGQITARVLTVQNTDPWSKGGVMFRESLAAGSKHAFALISAGSGAAFQRRTTTDGSSAHTAGPAVTAPYWVRLNRTNNVFTAYTSPDGSTWTQMGTPLTNSMTGQIYVGLAVTAHNNALSSVGTFDNVTLSLGSNAAPSVAITSPTNGASFLLGNNLALTATATDDNGPVAKVEYFRELIKLGESTSAPYNVGWNNVPAGGFVLKAVATDGFGLSSTSAPVTINIGTTLGTNAFVARINFQTNTTTLFTGYLPDSGLAYGNRGNGYTYGWNIDNTANSRRRNAANSFDARYDTFNHMQKAGGATNWEISLPNGSYQVRIISGDASNFDGYFQLNAESVLIVNGQPTAASRWVEGIGSVLVNDGRLTVGNALSATNNKICFIEITALPTNTPPSWLSSPTKANNGPFAFTLQGGAGMSYVIEATTNLKTWIPLTTNTTTSNLFQFIDPSATNYLLRFYRARVNSPP